jgi:hypothetical protein
MARKKQNDTMARLAKLRAERERIEQDFQKNRKRQEELAKRMRMLEGDDGTIIRAQAYLEKGNMEAAPSVVEEYRAAQDEERILREAARIKDEEYESVKAEASAQHKKSIMPDWIAFNKRKFYAIRDYEQAWYEEEELRKSFSELGLNDNLPFITWPGINPANLSQQREALQYSLKQQGLEEILQ